MDYAVAIGGSGFGVVAAILVARHRGAAHPDHGRRF
jgi:hypothetical protein